MDTNPVKLDLNDVAVFVAVVGEGGFAAAGRVLDLPGSAVSRRVARLESRVGAKLLHRTTRKVGLTEAGRRFFAHTADLSRAVEDGVRAVADSRGAPSGQVRVTAPPDDGGIVWALLSGFVRDHPNVDMELTHSLDRVDLIQAGVDVALRGGPAPDTDQFTGHKLFESRILLAASPAYLAVRGVPGRVEDLESHDGICMDPWAPNAIRRLRGDRSPVRVRMRNRLRANSIETARRAAVDGLGIAPLLALTCQDALDRGALVEVLRGCMPPSAPFWALAPLGRQRSAAADALLGHLVQTAPRIFVEGAV